MTDGLRKLTVSNDRKLSKPRQDKTLEPRPLHSASFSCIVEQHPIFSMQHVSHETSTKAQHSLPEEKLNPTPKVQTSRRILLHDCGLRSPGVNGSCRCPLFQSCARDQRKATTCYCYNEAAILACSRSADLSSSCRNGAPCYSPSG